MNNSKIKAIVFYTLLLNVFVFNSLYSQSANQTIYNSSGTFTVPDCISEITVEVWGAGGGGGTNTDDSDGGSGGGGGAYSRSTFTVTPGTTYSITIGAGGAANTAGQPSLFATTGGVTLVSANGGSGGSGAGVATGGAGGTTGGIGDVKFAGGAGGNAGNDAWSMGGGGGSSAGHSQNGRPGSTPVTHQYSWGYPGGAAPVGGAQGGTGGNNTDNCSNYHAVAQVGYPGGGGGGGGSENNSPATRTGARGGDGKVVVNYGPVKTVSTVGVNSDTWTCPAGITKLLVQVWGAGGGGGGNDKADGSGGAGGGGAYSETEITVSAGQVYNISVGGGGSGGANTGANGGKGGNSSVSSAATGSVYALAEGGYGGVNRNGSRAGGSGGQASNGIGNFKFSGGNGGNGINIDFGHGGGGGASAGYNANGGNGQNGNPTNQTGCSVVGGAGGVAPTGGVDGAPGYSHWNYPYDGNGHGAGGAGGSEKNNATTGVGGDGGDGKVFLDWNPVWSLSSNAQGGGGTPIAAGNICTTGDAPIHSFGIKGHNLNTCVNSADFTGFKFTLSGTFQTSDIADFKLYWTSTPIFSTANLLSTITPATTATLQTFPAFSLTLDSTQIYFWVTANIKSGSTDGRTIAVNQTNYGDVTLSRNVSRPSYAGASGTQTIRKTSLSSTLTPPAICSGTTFTYTATSAQPSPTFSWSRAAVSGITQSASTGTGNVSEVLTNTTTAAINVTYVYYTASGGCINAGENVIVTVNPSPILSSTLTPSAICSGTTFTYTATSATSGATFKWSRAAVAGITQSASTGTGNVSEVLTNTTTAAVNVIYTYTTTANSCSGSIQNVVVAVNPLPVLNSTLTAPAICSGTTFTYTATSATSGVTFSWNRASIAGITPATSSGSGDVNESLTNSTTAPIDVTYSYITTTNGCSGATQNIVVRVNPIPVLSSSLNGGSICSGTAFTYTATSSTSGASFAWIRPAVSGVSQPSSNGTANISEVLTDTTYNPVNVTYTYTTTANGCSNTGENVTLIVNPTPTLSSTLTPSAICSETSFSYTPSGNVSGSSFVWSRSLQAGISQAFNSGNGSISETLTNTTSSQVNVTYVYTTSANNCSNNQNVVVGVHPSPQGEFTGNTRCTGNTSLGKLTWTATAGINTYTVEFAPGIQTNVSSGVSFTLSPGIPAADSTFTLTKVTDGYGCVRTSGFTVPTATVAVTGTPLSINSGTPVSTTTCAGTTASFHVQATGVNAYAWEVSADGGTNWDTITTAGVGPVYSNYTTSTLLVNNATTAHNGYQYRARLTPACDPDTLTATVILTVNPVPKLSSPTGNVSTICTGTTATYTAIPDVPSSTFVWTRAYIAGIAESASTGTGNVNEVLTNTTTVPIDVVYNYVATSPDNCSNSGENVIITVNPNADIVLTSVPATVDQHICKNDALTPITYTVNSVVNSVTVTGLPAGASYSLTGSTLTIQNNPSVDGVFIYTVTTIGLCVQTSTTGTITSGLSIVTLGADTQSVCKNAPITNIVYAVGSNNATVAGLPPGVLGVYSSGLFTISGTPTAEGVFNYTVTTLGCSTVSTRTGIITVGGGVLSGGADTQAVCKNQPIIPIKYKIVGGVVSVNGLPPGVNYVINATNDTITISGSSSIDAYAPYSYTVSTVGGSCPSSSFFYGEITVGGGLVTLGADTQAVCKNQPIVPIKYKIVGGVATVTGLPPGVNYVMNATNDTLTISGSSPIDAYLPYSYTVSTVGGSCPSSSFFYGEITVGGGLVTTGADTQAVCKNQAIAPIKYKIVGGVASVTGLPPGVNYVINATNDTITISGSSSIDAYAPYSYTVSTVGGSCPSSSFFYGEITVGGGLLTVGADTQAVCKNQPITPIKYKIVGGVANVTGLPSGVNYVMNATNDTLTISGSSPIDAYAPYSYTVSTVGGSCPSSSFFYGEITVGGGLLTVGADTQAVCKNQAITPIQYKIVGGVASVTGLPQGVNYVMNATNDTLTISGSSPVDAHTPYSYTVSTVGGSCPSSSFFYGEITVGGGLLTVDADTQAVCKNQAITPIKYKIVGGVASVSGLPPGVSYVMNSTNDTLTISGSSPVDAYTPYSYIVSTTGGSCPSPSFFYGEIAVGGGLVTTGADTQAVCKNQPITPIKYKIVGGVATVTGLPPGVNYVMNATNDTLTISGSSPVDAYVPYSYTVSTVGGSCPSSSFFYGEITVGGGLVTLGADTQAVCKNQAITPIKYKIVGGVANVTGLPPGVNYVMNATNDTLTISGSSPIDAYAPYSYTVSTVGGSCPSSSFFYGEITVGGGLVTTGADTQAVCKNQPIVPIKYKIVGGVANVTGLPPGVSYVMNATNDTLIISGSSPIDAYVPYSYTVSTVGGSCPSPSFFYGEITVGGGLVTQGLDTQAVCKTQLIQPIKYKIIGGVATVTGLPIGITAALNSPLNDTLTISGSSNLDGIYNYTVSTLGGSCVSPSYFYGNITIGGGLIQPGGSNVQAVCSGVAITPIRYKYVGGVVAVTGLPASMTFSLNVTNDTVTISGSSTVLGTYVYTVSTQGGLCTTYSVFNGTLTIGIGSPVNNNNHQQLCIGDAITPITYPTPGSAVVATGLPPGVTGVAGVGNYVISGTPTTAGVYNYSVTTLLGNCPALNVLTGTIIITNDTINAVSGALSQTLCLNQAMEPITFVITGSASNATFTGTGSGLTGTGNNAGQYTLSGTPPAVSGIYTYTVQTVGSCLQGVSTQVFTLQVVDPIANFSTNTTAALAPADIVFTNSSSLDAVTYKWDFGDGNTSDIASPTNTYNNPGAYTAKLIVSYNGLCSDSLTADLTIFELTFPNVFTPNGDGVNDTYYIKPLGIDQINVEIYNRWGSKVAAWDDVNGYWDGRDGATDLQCPVGTYFYILKVVDKTGKEIIKKGDMYLTR